MGFLQTALAGLILLGLASVAVVEASCLIGRTYSQCYYWLRYRYPSWRSARQVRALKRRYGRARESVPFGRLRSTRSRAQELGGRFGDGPPEA
jgi:hypothetical protein